MHVNIYIETSFKGPAEKRAAGAWIVEYILQSGQPVTRGGILYSDRTTENQLALNLIIQALALLTKTCRVRVFTECRHVLNTMNNHWLGQWQKNGWINGKGRMVRNAGEWRRCAELFGMHVLEWTSSVHAYRGCMQGRLRKELEKEHGAPDNGMYVAVKVPEWNTNIITGRRQQYV